MKKVLFNASVILAGINSPSGGSAKLLSFAKRRKIQGVISEIILSETLKHAGKLNRTQKEMVEFCDITFSEILRAPHKKSVQKYLHIVIDEGDAHVLASAEEGATDYLVTLDKKHLLVLKS